MSRWLTSTDMPRVMRPSVRVYRPQLMRGTESSRSKSRSFVSDVSSSHGRQEMKMSASLSL